MGRHNLLPTYFASVPKTNDVFYGEEEKFDFKKIDFVSKKTSDLDQSIIFCIDCSGSMEGTNMTCVRNAINSQMHEILMKFQKKKKSFNNVVKVYGDGFKPPKEMPLAMLDSLDQCLQFGEGLEDTYMCNDNQQA